VTRAPSGRNFRGSRRAEAAPGTLAAALILLVGPFWGAPASGAPAPEKPTPPQIQPPLQPPPQSAPHPTVDAIRGIDFRLGVRVLQDSLGNSEFAVARRLFQAGLFDSAAAEFQRFAARFPRNLLVNDALEHVYLIRESRERGAAGDDPLRIHAQVTTLRSEGLADSAAALVRSALERFPNARLRHHWRYFLAEAARDKGDHAAAIQFALTVADTTSRSRLAPYALRLAGDETIAMGEDPAKALRFYQALLERYPNSPLAPPVRAQVLDIRKKLQL